MICDISNAYPCNIAVDAAHNVQFRFVFYGDGCKDADFILYDSTNSAEKPKELSKHLYDNRRVYYNGEEIDANTNGGNLNGGFVNGHSYIWKVRMFEEVSIGAGKFPSVRRMSGEIAKSPFIFGKIQNPAGVSDSKRIYIEKNLDITLPVWMRIGTDTTYRIVTSYDAVTGECVLKNAFDDYPSPGADYSLTTVRNIVPAQIQNNQLFIEKGITELTGTEFTVTHNNSSENVWFMEINNTYVAITAYNSKTGLVTLDSAGFSAEEPGTKYNIWTSFIDSRYYAINTKETPSFSSALAYADGENILFEAELKGNHLVKYYWLDIYEDGKQVATTKRIYMAKLSYYYKKARPGKEYHAVIHVVTQDGMTNQEDTAWWKSGTVTNVTNKCKLISVSESRVGGVSISFDSVKQAAQITVLGAKLSDGELATGNSSSLSVFYIDKGLVVDLVGKSLVFDGEVLPIKSYSGVSGRIETKQPASKYYGSGTKYKICEPTPADGVKVKVLKTDYWGTTLVGNYDKFPVYDYACRAGVDYQYIILPYILNTQATEGHKYIANFMSEITMQYKIPRKKCWAIYGLKPRAYKSITNDDTRIYYAYQDGIESYEVTEIWLAVLDIERANPVTQNLNKVVYIGDHRKPVGVAGASDYDTFSLTFTIGDVNCPGNKIVLGTIKDIRQWKSLVARAELVMLKDPDGNIWVGAITGNTYDMVHHGSLVEYNVTFDFTDLKDETEVLIQG